MKYTYLLKQCAQHMYSVARQYDKSMRLIEFQRVSRDFSDEAIADRLSETDFFAKLPKNFPIIFSVSGKLTYCLIPSPNHYFLLGPVNFSGADNLKHTTEMVLPPDLESFGDTASLISLDLFSDEILLLYNLFRSGNSDEPFMDIYALVENNYRYGRDSDVGTALHKMIFEGVENGFIHNPYSHEKRQVRSITDGDVQMLEEILKERFPNRYGTLSKNPLRQEIYIGIVETTLASRAAINGGLDPETAFFLSDTTIQKLDKCHDAATAMRISYESQLYYAKLVHDLNDSHNSESSDNNRHVTRCKDYIMSHLHEKIMIRDIARAIGLEENYLSTLFKKYEGMTISNYILREKIKLAKNLLIYSNYSYSEIASYLGFYSHSHFGQAFRKITGYTPKEYRMTFEKEDFLADVMRNEE